MLVLSSAATDETNSSRNLKDSIFGKNRQYSSEGRYDHSSGYERTATSLAWPIIFGRSLAEARIKSRKECHANMLN